MGFILTLTVLSCEDENTLAFLNVDVLTWIEVIGIECPESDLYGDGLPLNLN